MITVEPFRVDGHCTTDVYQYVMYNATAVDSKSKVAGIYLMPYDDFQTIRLTSRSNASSPIPSIRFDSLNSCQGNASYTIDHCYTGLSGRGPRLINRIKTGTCIMINNTHSNKPAAFSIAYAFGDTQNMRINYTASIDMSEGVHVNGGQPFTSPNELLTTLAFILLSFSTLMTIY
ncbi:hypothetical protein BDF22DRAFT_743762 [Syncephalis plumigaleata]|nr:hypothetical protein BDF22DRAFT_743762 [Syncephalis plumigaleata]